MVAEPSETIEDACADVCRRPGPCNATCVTECDVSLRNRLRWWVKAQKAKALIHELRRRRQDSHPANFAIGALGGFLAGFAVAWVLRGWVLVFARLESPAWLRCGPRTSTHNTKTQRDNNDNTNAIKLRTAYAAEDLSLSLIHI